jgi:hypothetical protein
MSASDDMELRRVLETGAGRVDFGAPRGLAAATLTGWKSWSMT